MESIGFQTASAAIAPPSTSGNAAGTSRRLLRADEFLVAALLSVPAASPNGGLDIRA